MSTVLRKTIPQIITTVIFGILIIEWFFPSEIGSAAGSTLREFGIIILTFATVIGAVGFYIREGNIIRKKSEDWIWSIWTLFVVSAYILIGLTMGTDTGPYHWIYSYVLVPLNASVYGSISFYIAAASYKVLKFRSTQAVVLLIPAFIMLLANTPLITSFTTIFSQAGSLLMTSVVSTAYRGIRLGSALGTLASGFRTILGWEAGWLGVEESE